MLYWNVKQFNRQITLHIKVVIWCSIEMWNSSIGKSPDMLKLWFDALLKCETVRSGRHESGRMLWFDALLKCETVLDVIRPLLSGISYDYCVAKKTQILPTSQWQGYNFQKNSSWQGVAGGGFAFLPTRWIVFSNCLSVTLSIDTEPSSGTMCFTRSMWTSAEP